MVTRLPDDRVLIVDNVIHSVELSEALLDRAETVLDTRGGGD